ncbi:MAG: nitroreductase family protein, partial [Muribaculaceae bacterium]|nr:nitroreductase family protein [Muribaculaceae bacterium]
MDFDSFRRLVISNRTVRRFQENRKVPVATLEELVELTRYCPSGRNAQPLRYVIVTEDTELAKVFLLLMWACYFADWDGPE